MEIWCELNVRCQGKCDEIAAFTIARAINCLFAIGDEELAEEIRAAQGPEIDQLNALLESWGQEPAQDMEDMEGMDHEGMDHEGMTGMMSEEQMAELEAAEGGEFDTMFLQMMIEHHEGAVEMAQAEQEDGVFADAVALAESIEASQTAEIELMEDMLGQ